MLSKIVFCLGYNQQIINRLNELRYKVIIISDKEESCIKISINDIKERKFGKVDLSNYSYNSVYGVIIAHEYFVELGSYLIDRYFPNLNGIDGEKGKLFRNKFLMKSFLSKFEIPIKKFCALELKITYSNLRNYFKDDFIVKPKNECLSQGIKLIKSESNWNNFIKSGVNLKGYFAELYINDFREFCCDSFIVNGEVIFQFTAEYSTNCLKSNKEMSGFGVDYPGFASKNELESLKEVSRSIVEALAIKNGVCHMEFFYIENQGWFFGEVGYRLAGGFSAAAESYLLNRNVFNDYIDIFLKDRKNPSRNHLSDRYCGWYIYPKKPGKVSNINNLLENKDWIYEHKIYISNGDNLSFNDYATSIGAHAIYLGKDIYDLKNKSIEIKKLFSYSVSI